MEHRRWICAGQLLPLILAAMAVEGCCARKPAPPPQTLAPKPQEAWIKADAFCVLPLAEPQMPETGALLAESIIAAWMKGLSFPTPASVVTMAGGRYPALDTLWVDLGDATVVSDSKRPSIAKVSPTTEHLSVRDFALIAEPLRSKESRSQANFLVTAKDVQFSVQKSKEGAPLLLMTDASKGRLHFDTSVRDLERSMLSTAKEKGSRGLMTVRDISLQFTSNGPRSLNAVMHVSTFIGFLPAGLRFTARVDIDGQMNATIYNLTVDGDEALGPLIVYFIRPGLAKYAGKTKPLMSFPNPNMKLRNVQINAGEHVTLDAVFGR